jgi:uncharacterized protein YndB with AHSA1/START domain
MKRLAALLACAAALASVAGERMIVKEVVVKAPVEAAFKAWTTTEGVTSFFSPEARVEARPDGPFEIYINPYAKPGMKGADDMRVLAVQDNRMISFTWNAPPHLPEARKQRTVVILRFEPAGDGTKVSLTHVGWGDGGEWDQAYAYFDKAWAGVLLHLQDRFATGKPYDFTDWRARMKAMQDAEDAKAK